MEVGYLDIRLQYDFEFVECIRQTNKQQSQQGPPVPKKKSKSSFLIIIVYVYIRNIRIDFYFLSAGLVVCCSSYENI